MKCFFLNKNNNFFLKGFKWTQKVPQKLSSKKFWEELVRKIDRQHIHSLFKVQEVELHKSKLN